MKELKQCFIVVSVNGCWGRGKSPKEAAEKCKEAGSGRTAKANLYVVIGDDEASVSEGGFIVYDGNATRLCIMHHLPVGQYIKHGTDA